VNDQTYEPIELIVVDDSGEKHAAPVFESREDLTYIPLEENRGAHAARNVGFEHSDGEYIQFLDDDDRLRPEKIERQVNVLRNDSETGVVYCGREWETGEIDRPNPDVRGDVLEYALQFGMNPCLTSMMLIRRDHLEEIPMYDDLGGADDVAMKIELATRTQFEFIDEPLVVAGEPDRTLGTSWSAIEGRKKILRRYEDLYRRVDPDIRRTALAETYSKQGRRYLDDSLWSWRAITSFARAVYHDPDRRLLYWAEFVSSLLGQPGRKLARLTRRTFGSA
jgi:glycosyltransferase involved in cell wall biosynthesis